MADQVSRRHHFVPETLLRPWLVDYQGQKVLQGYYWDSDRRVLACKRRGVKAFCNRIDLLTLRAHGRGRDAIERVFFGTIDDDGAKARDRLLREGPSVLTGDERCNFARLLLSLDARRPTAVAQIRGAADHFAAQLNSDPDILAAMEAAGLNDLPASYYEELTGSHLDDHALTMIQRLVDNPKVGGRLINAHWHVVRFRESDDTLVLSDRPLNRVRGHDHPGGAWILPLTPRAAFVALNHPGNLQRIQRAPTHQLARRINVASAQSADRFVFSVSASHERWLPKHLGRTVGMRSGPR